MTQLDRDMRAYVDYLLWDPAAIFRMLRTHVRGVSDECVARCGEWPCLAYRVAMFAEGVYRARRLKHTPPPDDDAAAFTYAVHANSVETTAPMRAVTDHAPARHGTARR